MVCIICYISSINDCEQSTELGFVAGFLKQDFWKQSDASIKSNGPVNGLYDSFSAQVYKIVCCLEFWICGECPEKSADASREIKQNSSDDDELIESAMLSEAECMRRPKSKIYKSTAQQRQHLTVATQMLHWSSQLSWSQFESQTQAKWQGKLMADNINATS